MRGVIISERRVCDKMCFYLRFGPRASYLAQWPTSVGSVILLFLILLFLQAMLGLEGRLGLLLVLAVPARALVGSSAHGWSGSEVLVSEPDVVGHLLLSLLVGEAHRLPG